MLDVPATHESVELDALELAVDSLLFHLKVLSVELGEEVGLTVTGAARHVDSFEMATATVMKVLCLRAARVIVHSHKELARLGFLLPSPSPGQCEL